jgi:hypothetical protein
MQPPSAGTPEAGKSDLSPCLSLGASLQALEPVQEKENVEEVSVRPSPLPHSRTHVAAEEGPRRHSQLSSWAQEQEAKAAQLGEELARLQLQGRARLSSSTGLPLTRQSLQNTLHTNDVAPPATAKEEPAPAESTFKVGRLAAGTAVETLEASPQVHPLCSS